MAGPPIRTDIVEVYVFRRTPAIEFLHLRRARGVMSGCWAPVMGHVHEGESAVQTARRELTEETRYDLGHGLLAFWHLETVNTYYLASHGCIVMSPGFAAEVDPSAAPMIDDSHDALRWLAAAQAEQAMLWPGQRVAVQHILRDIVAPDAALGELLRIR